MLQIAAETDDPFLGLLRENPAVGQQAFGETLKVIITDQFHRVLFGAGGSWWEDDFLVEVEGWETEIRNTTLASVISANTGVQIAGNGFSA